MDLVGEDGLDFEMNGLVLWGVICQKKGENDG
jgi:hypothetical protein